jgi:acyl-CoA reductase-like NAD-dependent aldehyde dehydrogenase
MTAEATALDTATLDKALDDLHANAAGWVALPLKDKVAMLEALPPRIWELAEPMVAAAGKAKGYPAGSSWYADDWITGIWAFIQGVQSHAVVLNRVLKGEEPLKPKAVHTRPDGQVVVDAFPVTAEDQLLLSGYKAQIWMQPGVNAEQTRKGAVQQYRGAGYEDPGVSLVLGAGNVGTITTLDILDQMYAQGNVCVVKMNPVNDYLGPFYEKIFKDFIDRGWLRFAYGGADVGGYLVNHDGVDSVHMTGSSVTYDAIVWGTDDQAETRRANNTPLVHKPFSAELGGVSPCIVVQGEWSDADIAYQAEHIVSSKLNNAGHNCIATQILVLPEEWKQADQLIAAIRKFLDTVEPRSTYYPRSVEKTEAACDGMSGVEFLNKDKTRALIPHVDPNGADSVLRNEVFAGVMGIVRLPGATPREFMRHAVAFANDVLPGTLGATIIIDPKTRKQNPVAFDEAIANLRYGSIGINIWSGLNFLLGYTPWGAFPGSTPQDIGSGVGFVHNAFMLHGVEKGITEIPFRPAPRALLGGEIHMSPKSVWFVNNKTAELTARRLSKYLVTGKKTLLPGIFASALRG